jgi:hypothetical protein
VSSLEVSHPTVVPALRSVEGLLGNPQFADYDSLHDLNPPHNIDFIFHDYILSSGLSPTNLPSTTWGTRLLIDHTVYINSKSSPTPPSRPAKSSRRYKPVAQWKKPIPFTMPKEANATFAPIPILPPLTLPTRPPPIPDLPFSERMTRERLDLLLAKLEDDILSTQEVDLLAYILVNRANAFAWTYAEKGEFKSEYYPDYWYLVDAHKVWVRPRIPTPESIKLLLVQELRKGVNLGKYRPSVASYRSSIYCVAKKPGSDPPLRITVACENLNEVTIRDSYLPPKIHDLAEQFAGHSIYFSADAYSGFDGRHVDEGSQPLSTFDSPIGPLQQTTLLQGHTNSLQEFCRCMDHAFVDLKTDGIADNFVDDVAVLGPDDKYGEEPIDDNPQIRRYIFEFFQRIDRFLAACISSGITMSGHKTFPALSRLSFAGSVVSHDGWLISPSFVDKVLLWPYSINVSEVHMFLGLTGGARRWITGYATIAYPLTRLLRADTEWSFDIECMDAVNELKHRITTSPILIKINYPEATLISKPPRASDEGLVVVGVDSSWKGAGWVLYQIRLNIKRPTLYGSTIFNSTQQNYGQPKTEVFGLFVALKALRFRLAMIHFRLEHDATALVQMLRQPNDLPNAPMMRWISFIRLYDMEFLHVPGSSMKMEDAFSRGPFIDTGRPEEAEDAESFLDQWETGANIKFLLNCAYERLHSPYAVHARPSLPISLPRVPTVAPWTSVPRTKDDAFSLLGHRLSTSCDSDHIYSNELYARKSPVAITHEFKLGDEYLQLEVITFANYIVPISTNETTKRVVVDENWDEIRSYLTSGFIPHRFKSDKERKRFVRKTNQFTIIENRLYMLPKKKSSTDLRLVIEDPT